MKISKNIGKKDRLVRILLAEILLILGFFWVSSSFQIIFYILALVLLLTGIFKFCGLYTLVGTNTCEKESTTSKKSLIIFIVLLLSIGIVGSYYSNFFTKKFFLEDYNSMNKYYKQTLLNTGKEKREESITNYDALVREYKIFLDKYTKYHPFAISGDNQFNGDLEKISNIITSLKDKVYTGNLKESHLDFEKVRPIFQDILKRNNFSMLAVSLVDFHDVMEKVIGAADAKKSTDVLITYKEADEKLKAVEEVANDSEIIAIRQKLDEVKSLAEQGKIEQLSGVAAELKANFVTVYMKRG